MTGSDHPESNERVYFHAILMPNRSLSLRGFWFVMGLVAAVSFILGLVFFLAGAWPVVGFFGFDVLLLYLAFRYSYRQGRMHETLHLTAECLSVTRVLATGRRLDWQFQPAWVRVTLEGDREDSRIILSSHGERLEIGSFLAPDERTDVAKALQTALREVKR